MSSALNPIPSLKEQTDRDELAGAKLWSFYVSEAEKYDKALVAGWRSDMDGLLIFAGLFSASLTAFLIESYKTLSPDQGAVTIAILAQISNQLHGGSNISAVDVAPLMNVRPTSAALVCNTFWFLSLGFSLACALIATLVEQWTRQFIYASELKQSPIIRARVFAYLFYGLERFGMHAMVQLIPLLLHISLLLFFAGLIAFLEPINTVVAVLAAAMFVSISLAYLYLTVLPMFSSDSPYRTPLSNIAWGFFRQLHALSLAAWKWLLDEEGTIPSSQPGQPIAGEKSSRTMFDVMLHDATDKSEGRAKRDGRAMVWALRSLTSDDELEPFVEALPELVWGPNGRRHGYDNMINMLLESDLRLIPRIEALLRDPDSGLLAADLQVRRQIFCIKALWALACFSVSEPSAQQSFPIFDHTLLASLMTSTTVARALLPYLFSAYAMVRCSDFRSLSTLIRGVVNNGTISPIPLKQVQLHAGNLSFSAFSRMLDQLIDSGWTPTSTQRALDALNSCTDLAHDILADYWRRSASVDQISYQFEVTSSLLQQVALQPSTASAIKLRDTFTTLIDENSQQVERYKTIHPFDLSLDGILNVLRRNPDCLVDTTFLRLFLLYMANRPQASGDVGTQLFPTCDPTFIGSLLTKCVVAFDGRTKSNALGVIWLCVYWQSKVAIFDAATVMVINATTETFVTSCTVAVVKADMLRRALGLPPLTSYVGQFTLSQQGKEDFGTILLEFLDSCKKFPPDEGDKSEQNMGMQTIKMLTSYLSSKPSFSPSFQRRFANHFSEILSGDSPTLGVPIINWVGSVGSPPIQGFNDPGARATILEASKMFSRIHNLRVARTEVGGTLDVLLAELASDTSVPAAGAPIDLDLATSATT
ncbi:hypothetical protein MSAN_00877900 [Mycena sanguinolenta]|uniref:DUF6535 domain-containing protein n=1 Tax=Mycena sanguinolenta TaxID=230812 RepID=A0A8H6YZL9_9AGAR|nr:hypothetical protein MSAN_00877900 [Mycena sanguinolenta]